MQHPPSRTVRLHTAFILFMWVACGNLVAKEIYTVPKVKDEIKVDGRLDEPVWEKALKLDLLYEYQPGENTPALVKTECLLFYDHQAFYVAFRAYDPDPSSIRAHLMDRDAIDTLVQDDYVGFMLDTYNDGRRAVQFRVNALGVQAEALNDDIGGDEDWNYDLIWDSVGRITPEGYIVEIKIPFKQLRFIQTNGIMTWGFQAERSWPRNVRHRILTHRWDYGLSCSICQFDKITGLQDVRPALNAELDPTLTVHRSDIREEFSDSPFLRGSITPEFGLSGRWSVTTGLSLNATVNPDFSQVEADVAQLEVNTRFALFFPEKRPFFLEGSDYFSTPIDGVFTRTIVDPFWGLKFTGKQGKNVVGFLGARDRWMSLIFPSNQDSDFTQLDIPVTTSIFRYRRDFGQASALGFLFTDREGSQYHNRTFGIDGLWRFASSDYVRFQYLHSWTLYPPSIIHDFSQPNGAFDGDAYTFRYVHRSRNWNWNAGYREYTPGFRADAGFVPRVDFRKIDAELNHTWWSQGDSWWTSVSLGGEVKRVTDHSGLLTDSSIIAYGNFRGPWQSDLTFAGGKIREYFRGVSYNEKGVKASLTFQPGGTISIGFSVGWMDGIDYDNLRAGQLMLFQPGLGLKLGRHISTQIMYSLQSLSIDAGRVFSESLTEIRWFYHFSTRFYVRAIVQYRDIERTPALYIFPVNERNRRLLIQLLASYKINPQTLFLMGYSDSSMGVNHSSLVDMNRTFFIKIGYAWTL